MVALAAVMVTGAVVPATAADDYRAYVATWFSPLATAEQQAELTRFNHSAGCRRITPQQEFSFVVTGRDTRECSWRVPVRTRNPRVTITGRLTRSIPSRFLRTAYLSVSIRPTDAPVRYRMRVFPRTGRFNLSAERWDPRDPTDRTVRRITGGDRIDLKGVGRPTRFGFRLYTDRWGLSPSRIRLAALLGDNTIVAFGLPRVGSARGIVTVEAGRSAGRGARGIGAAFSDLQVARPGPPR